MNLAVVGILATHNCTGFHGACGNAYIREERLASLLCDVVQRVQLPAELADWIADGLRDRDNALAQSRQQATVQLTQRRGQLQGRLDRGYDEYLEGRIPAAFWLRKSGEWEAELGTIEAELGRLSGPIPAYEVTAEKILELAKQAGFLYQTQSPAEQRRLLDTVLSNCTFDRGTLCPTYSKPFDLLVQGHETGNWRGRRDSNPRPPA